jgi:hypothetical protein
LDQKKDQMANDDHAQAMIDWAHGLPVAELAAELMAAFAPNGPGDRSPASM